MLKKHSAGVSECVCASAVAPSKRDFNITTLIFNKKSDRRAREKIAYVERMLRVSASREAACGGERVLVFAAARFCLLMSLSLFASQIGSSAVYNTNLFVSLSAAKK